MSDLTNQVEFLRSLPAPTDEDGFENARKLLPGKKDKTSAEQKARAQDLFIRGVLSEDELKQAQESQSGFERVIGRANFLPAVFLEIGAKLSRATCLIRTSGTDFRGNLGSWSGTGFLVSPNVLLTNNHVINTFTVAEAAECVFDFQIDQRGKPSTTKTFALRPDRLFLTSKAVGGLDFTFVWVDGEPGNEFGFTWLDRSSHDVTLNEFANVVGHPDGRMKEVSLQENNILWFDDTVVHYTSDTEGGSSGAAVSNNSWNLVALHHASKRTSTEVEGHDHLNEGIRIKAIAALIETIATSKTRNSGAAKEILQLFEGVDEELGFFGTLGRPEDTEAASEFEAVVNTYKGASGDIDVGFWNVEWLTSEWAMKTPAVAQVIHQMNLDVWALEEASPDAAKALAKELEETFGRKYDWAAAEPDSSSGKQSCVILWNTETVDCKEEKWGEPVETWLQARSRDFDELGFEAVHGKIFNRYPALFKIKSKLEEVKFDFFLVALHLKAKSEGSLRRRMASKILAAAVKHKIESGADKDWIIGGDYNATLSSGDFDALIEGDMVPVSAEDEENGAFTFLKWHKSMIDHIFLSPNLAEVFTAEDFFIVAADRKVPDFISDISDHRPVLMRLSLGQGEESGEEFESASTQESPELNALKKLLADHPVELSSDNDAKGFERRRRGASSSSSHQGYQEDFLGSGALKVPFPSLTTEQQNNSVVVDSSASGINRYLLHYTHFSLVMNQRRRFAWYTICNIDGSQMRGAPRTSWMTDDRIPLSSQADNTIYKNNDLDRGHLVRRLDPVWGTPAVASQANKDTFFYTNAVPQHKDLNQKEWLALEDYVLSNSKTHDLKATVLTGPVLAESDRPYRGIQIPAEFWKIVVIENSDTHELSATAYMLTQKDMITGFEFIFGKFKTYQVRITDVESNTGLSFGELKEFDPKARVTDGFESATLATLITGSESLQL